MPARGVLLALAVLMSLAATAAATPGKKHGFWCARWSRDGGGGSSCAREKDLCERAAEGFAHPGVTAPPCAWQETAWSSRINMSGSPEEWLFAEKSHCQETTATYDGTACRLTK
jgi:hypothetical protein